MDHGCHPHARDRIGRNDTLRDDILEASYRQHQFPNPDSQPYRSLHGHSYGDEATQGNADMVAQDIRFLPLPGYIMRIIPRLCRGYQNFGIIFACQIHDSDILLKEARYKATPRQTIINYQKRPYKNINE